jgi:L-lactate dehydrogenase complex protein LldG
LVERGQPVDLPDDLELARVIGKDEDAVVVFVARAEQAGMHPHRVADEAALVAEVADLMAEVEAKSAIVPDEAFPARKAIVERLEEAGITLLDVNDPDASFDADVGITGVERAVAETASLSVISGAGRRRLASLAVPCHIAIVRADQIVADLVDWAEAAPADRPAKEVLISGPSKTADIEMILVEGVHGPGAVHVVIVG